jgi:thioredoxin reductase (NADPH)
VISGGGDSALDWALYFSDNYAKSVTLIHRSEQFRAHNDSVQKALDYAEKGKIKLFLNSEVSSIEGENKLSSLNIKLKKPKKILQSNVIVGFRFLVLHQNLVLLLTGG